ncbi:MAG TPA: transposase [Steroidobacteraceae bacterium]|nr:transposase [Steroidobacteraceae bacterium]
MPRTSRAIVSDHCYHVINRGNNRADRFHDRHDFIQFLWLMAEAGDHIDLPMIGACLVPNHAHFVVRPRRDQDLARWMHWLFTTYSRRYHKKYGSTGRVWRGRYKAFAIQGDVHLQVVLRYVERNALRANLTTRAEDWEWGSLNWRTRACAPLALAPCPVTLPDDWVAQKAIEFGLEQAVAPLGRPKRRM